MAGELVTPIINILKIWAKKHNTKQLSKFYLFGSLINGSGNQFLPDESDIDLIVILQDSGPLNRAKICQKLQKAKHEIAMFFKPLTFINGCFFRAEQQQRCSELMNLW